MTRFLCAVAVAAVALSGCGKKAPPKPEETPTPAPGPTPMPGSLPPRTGLPAVDRQAAIRDLKQLGLAYHNYHDTNGKGPAKPADLLPFADNNAKLIGNVESGYYVLFLNVNFIRLTDGTSNTVLGYAWNAPADGGVVLFADGQVKQVSKADFAAAPKAGG